MKSNVLLALALSACTAFAPTPPSIGQGPGYHDPRSPFKPLEERADIVSWKLLSQVTARAASLTVCTPPSERNLPQAATPHMATNSVG